MGGHPKRLYACNGKQYRCASPRERNERLTDWDSGPSPARLLTRVFTRSATGGKSAEGAENRDCAKGDLRIPQGEGAARRGESTQKLGETSKGEKPKD